MERLVSPTNWGRRRWSSPDGAASAGRDLQPRRCAPGWWTNDHTVAQCRPCEDRLPGAVGECHRADHDQCEWFVPPDNLSSIQLGSAVCPRPSVQCAYRIADL